MCWWVKTKSAPLPERPCEQLTYCAKNESEQWDYINRVAKRHNCRITGKTKATRYGGPSTQATRYPQRMSITNNATFAAGGQCDQSDLVRSKVCNESFFLCSLRNFSRAKAHGANLSDSCSIFLRRLFRAGDNVLVNSLSVIVLSCIAMRRSTSHHSADSDYSCSLALRRWRRLISPSNAAVTNCPVLSPSSLTLSMASTIWSGTRASILFDFAFTDFVAISDFRLVWCPTMIARKKFNAMLDVSHTDKITCVRHLIFISHKMTKPRTVGAVTGRLTTNDSKSIEVAMRNHTTHPQGRDSHNLNKYIWRFIALSTAQPRVITIEATSEQEARQQSPAGCVMVFAARIRQEVRHVQ
ncbi:host cell division inhibitor Icd-like protein [Escherichia coli]|nr:host cell division inhibitor Icd-like protein [Escherichia coli]